MFTLGVRPPHRHIHSEHWWAARAGNVAQRAVPRPPAHKLTPDKSFFSPARKLGISTAEREEFEHHAECLGLRAEQIVYAPWKTVKNTLEGTGSPKPPQPPPAGLPHPGLHLRLPNWALGNTFSRCWKLFGGGVK